VPPNGLGAITPPVQEGLLRRIRWPRGDIIAVIGVIFGADAAVAAVIALLPPDTFQPAPKIPTPSPTKPPPPTPLALPCKEAAQLWSCHNGGLLTTSWTACDDASTWGPWGPPDPIKICKGSGSLARTFYVCSKGGIGTSPHFCEYVGGESSSITLELRVVDSTCARPQVFFRCDNGGAMGTSGNFCYYPKGSLGSNKDWGPITTIALCTAE
jgi:hypothetical protein